MSITLNQLVRDQILAEGPEYLDGDTRLQDEYVDEQLDALRTHELLERISTAVQTLTERPDPRQWL